MEAASPHTGSARGRPQVRPYEYPHGPDGPRKATWVGWEEPREPEERPAQAAARDDAALRADFEKRLAEETRRSFEAGCERGRQEGRQAEHETLAAQEEQRRRQAIAVIQSFAEERDRYLHAVEHEVVELALAIAARILRREAQMDPLLLTAAVRVALGQLATGTEVRLRVPPADLELWRQSIALLPNLALKPQVVAGEGMCLGEAVLEAELGSVDLGIRAQLGEIERGFFDCTPNSGRKTIEAKTGLPSGEETRA